MRWLLVGYMFLFIDRPFEVWPWLGDLHVERVYMLVTVAAWAVYPGKRWLPNPLHAAYFAFAAAVVGCWVLSPYPDRGEKVLEDWFKVVIFYGLVVTTVHDERGLKELAVGFVGVMGLYLLHSLREYLAGRHTYRMGIARMIGVDTTLGDPNSFGASIVFALPVAVALWRAGIGGRPGKLLLSGYVGLSALCILLTGSRSSLLGLMLWSLLVIWGTRYRFAALAAFAVAAPVAFMALPPSLQNRFETIINPEVGPANAKESGEGRIEGLVKGVELWAASPLTGVGPGAWRPATGSKVESHNLYGQLVGELGTAGAVAFGGVLLGLVANVRAAGRVRKAVPEWRSDLPFTLPRSLGVAVFLLLFMGNFGHNLFRFSWLWYGGFLVVARECVRRRLATEWDVEPDMEADDEAETWPPGWVRHDPHAA